MKVLKFHHFGIEVKDIDKSIDFYTNILGFKVSYQKTYSKDFNETFVLIDLDGGILELRVSHSKDVDTTQPSVRHHIAFETDDVDTIADIAKKNNIKIIDGPRNIKGDIRLATLLDPDNNVIDFGQVID